MGNAEQGMIESFDTLASSRRLRKSGMPMEQADATVEVVSSAVRNLVTREYLDSRLDALEERLGVRYDKLDTKYDKLDAKIDKSVAELGAQQARATLGIVLSQVAVAGVLFAALTYFGIFV